MLEKSICHLRDVGSILSLLFFLMKILLANSQDPDKMPYYVGSDLNRHCLPMNFYRFPCNNGFNEIQCGNMSKRFG